MYYEGKKVKHNSSEFRQLFDSYFPTLCLFADKILKDSDTSKDIVQEVFIKLLALDARFENEKAVKAYLYVLTKNACIDYLNKQRKKGEISEASLQDHSENQFLEEIVREETYRLLELAIRELAPQSQKVVELTLNQLTK